MTIQPPRIALTILLAIAGSAAEAQPRPPGGPAPFEQLATVRGLSVAQQQEIRRAESERRDAHDTLRIKQRAEHERIDEQTEQRLRKALGDEGYTRYVEWKAKPHGGPMPGRARGPDRETGSDQPRGSGAPRAPEGRPDDESPGS